VWHQYTLRIADDARTSRDDVVEGLIERGVGAGVYYPKAVYDYEPFRDNPLVHIDGGCPVAERVARQVVSLPVHQHLTESDRDAVIAAVRDLLA
jgi:dTDP-4-amino-4,6-dideoxygalactose transaminase